MALLLSQVHPFLLRRLRFCCQCGCQNLYKYNFSQWSRLMILSLLTGLFVVRCYGDGVCNSGNSFQLPNDFQKPLEQLSLPIPPINSLYMLPIFPEMPQSTKISTIAVDFSATNAIFHFLSVVATLKTQQCNGFLTPCWVVEANFIQTKQFLHPCQCDSFIKASCHFWSMILKPVPSN